MNNYTWIKFDKNNLPKRGRVLVSNGHYVIPVEFGIEDNTPFFHDGTGKLLDVTHWAYYPNPPIIIESLEKELKEETKK